MESRHRISFGGGSWLDKQNVKDHDKHMEELQEETAQKAEDNHPHGKAKR